VNGPAELVHRIGSGGIGGQCLGPIAAHALAGGVELTDVEDLEDAELIGHLDQTQTCAVFR